MPDATSSYNINIRFYNVLCNLYCIIYTCILYICVAVSLFDVLCEYDNCCIQSETMKARASNECCCTANVYERLHVRDVFIRCKE